MITRKAKYIFKSQNYTQKLYRPVPAYRHGTILNANYAICSSFFHPLGRAISTGIPRYDRYLPNRSVPVYQVGTIPICKHYLGPPTLRGLLTDYKGILKKKINSNLGVSKRCGRCKLCGNHDKGESMIKKTNYICRKDRNKFNLKQSLSCSDYGICTAQCLVCNHLYVGQNN